MVGRKFADCLSRRFRKAYDRINSDSIATWYFDLSGQDEIDVRAFFRFATLSNLTIRMAFERILTQELSPDLSQREGVELKEVILQGKGGRPSESLRDAFMFTAMVAANETTGIALVNTESGGDCAEFVADSFDISGKTLRRRWTTVAREVRESIKTHKPTTL